MEHAFFISDPINLKYFYNSKFDRIYFGNEICDNLSPTINQINRIINFCNNKRMSLSFVIPYCINDFKKIIEILSILPYNTEVVINNISVMTLINIKKFKLVFGRILTSFKENNLLIQSYYKQKRINRIEVNNIIEDLDLVTGTFNFISLYYPFVLKLYNQGISNKKKGIYKYDCSNREKTIKIEYYKNELMPDNIKNLNIDRLVYAPVLPVNNSFSHDCYYLDWNMPFINNVDNSFEWGSNKHDEIFNNILNKIKFVEEIKILDIGCGNGRNYSLFKNFNIKYYGIDTSSKAIEISKQKINEGIFFNENILFFDKLKNHFDLIIDYGCFHSIPYFLRDKYVKKVYSLLKKDGYLLIGSWKSELESKMPIYYSYSQLPEWGLNINSVKKLFIDKFIILECIEKQMKSKNVFIYFLLKRAKIINKVH